MSSSYVVEPQEGCPKKDDTLILMVNDSGVISVDQDTLQSLILNQSDAHVSVVRLGQMGDDAVKGNITLTVDPPASVSGNATDPAALVDPFMEMDSEQLERLETALQSEEAKQILGENVTAMLDMLTVEEQQNSIRHSIELDHCYTSRFSPSHPQIADPLPDVSCSDMDESVVMDLNNSLTDHGPTQTPSISSSSSCSTVDTTATVVKQTVTAIPRKILKQQPTLLGNRSKRVSTVNQLQAITTSSKLAGSTGGHVISAQLEGRASIKIEKVQERDEKGKAQEQLLKDSDNELFSSSESSASEDSDSDSDFGPWSPRKGIRARGGRRGLTTRGGSMAAFRRRGSNKQTDNEQARRLDFEMAAAVNAMKSPEKEEKPNKHSSKLLKRAEQIIAPKRKDDAVVLINTLSQEQTSSRTQSQTQLQVMHSLTQSRSQPQPLPPSTPPTLPPMMEQNVLQMTNQVERNLISANMIKEDTPSKDLAQNIVFAQNQVVNSPGDVKNPAIKKQVIIPKNKFIATQSSTVSSFKDTKVPVSSATMIKGLVSTNVQQSIINYVNQKAVTSHQKTVLPAVVKSCQKYADSRKEKKKDVTSDVSQKSNIEETKLADSKISNVVKKVIKKEHRKSDVSVAEVLGPALFSTPDIIRRVGSNYEPKTPESPTVTSTSAVHSLPFVSDKNESGPLMITSAVSLTSSISDILPLMTTTNVINEQMDKSLPLDISVNDKVTSKFSSEGPMIPVTLTDDKLHSKAERSESISPEINCVSNTTSKEMPPAVQQSIIAKHDLESSIESDEHLLATLGMESDKQLPNDEELLAEALLLQETLGVDLEHSGIVDSAPEISESIMSSSMMEAVSKMQKSTVLSQSPATTVALSTPAPIAIVSTPVKSEPTNKKDLKEPIQIVRGGRVITLPPIEAPATRSKRLQAKIDNHKIKIERDSQVQYQIQTQSQQHHHQQQEQQQLKVDPFITKSERILRAPAHVSFQNRDMIYDMDDNDEEENNSDSEDDPNRLWCICRQPHNNRFMICCDMCQDWFHGKCVHVTKAMGEQMENQGIEWVCPNCLKKKNEENKSKFASKRHRSSTDPMIKKLNQISAVPNTSLPITTRTDVKITPINTVRNSSVAPDMTFCVVCKKEARQSGIYCSNACILAHAASQIKAQKIDNKQQSQKQKSDIRIVVYNKKTGKVLTDANAPTASNLKNWLKEHPNYAVVKSNNLNTIQLGGKTVAAIKTQGLNTNKQLQGKPPSQSKTIYTKESESKQTILAPITKKSLSESALVCGTTSNQQRVKQSSVTTTSGKSLTLKQEPTPKTTVPQPYTQIPLQQNTQKPIATSTPKASVKKPLEAKILVSQHKQQQQSEQHHKQQQQPQQQQQPTLTKALSKKSETEPVRVNVRKTLADLLISRIKEAEDLSISEEEIKDLAFKIEMEMYKYFKDTSSKYRAKYRSLLFNIKDTKNLTLFHKIADRSLAPDAVVKLSPEEMASQELAEWREKETKHQLEMIEKNELDLMAQAKSVVVKTHKGEQIIENDGGIRTVDSQDIVTALHSSSVTELASSKLEGSGKEQHRSKSLLDNNDTKKKRDRRRSRSHDRSRHRHTDRDRSREKKPKKYAKHKDKVRLRNKDHEKFKDRDKKKEKDKDRKKDKYRSGHCSSRSLGSNSTNNKSLVSGRLFSHKEHKDKHKPEQFEQSEQLLLQQQEPLQQQLMTDGATTTYAPVKSIEERLWRHIEDEVTNNPLDGNESDISDREPSSTVTIKTPDINDDVDKEIEPKSSEVVPLSRALSAPVWRGFVYMADVAKFYVTAQSVSGNAKELMEGLSDSFEVVGRISPLTVWDYIDKMRKNANKEIVIVKLTATNDEEKIPYITLYSYLHSRNRLGVLRNISPKIKDFYVMPFSSANKLPSVLLPLEGSGLTEIREPLLLGIIVVHSRRKRSIIVTSDLSIAGSPLPKMPKKEPPPSDIAATTSRSYTPPPQILPSLQLLATDKDEVVSAQHFSALSKVVPELSSKMTLQTSSLSNKKQFVHNNDGCDNDDDDNNAEDDEPYSPGEPVEVTIDDNVGASAVQSTSNVKTPKSSSELQRKMEEITRQIEEEKQHIQNISSSFLGDTSTTLPCLGLDPLNNDDAIEAYRPTDVRSFTPPPQSMSNLTQPILEKVSNITIPPNLQEILANVKRQESSKIDSYIPSKPGATFLTTVSSVEDRNLEKHSSANNKTSGTIKLKSDVQSSQRKESISTLSLLSDYDIVKKAEEELAAMAVADAAAIASPSTFSNHNESPNSSASSVL